jgi:hypothetical protein
VTGYLDRLVARAAGQSPSGLTPRRRSRYEDAIAGGDGFQVVDAERVDAERVARRSAAPGGVPGLSSLARGVERVERASPAESPRRAAPNSPGDASVARSDRAPDDLRRDTRPAIEPAAGEDQPVAAGTVAAPAPVHDAPANPVHVAPGEGALPSPLEAGGVTPTASAHPVPLVHRAGVPDHVATTRDATSSREPGSLEGADAVEAPAVWPLTTSDRPARGTRRGGPTAATKEPVVVEVTIGRVEIRAAPELAPAVTTTSSAPPLADYLRDRARATGGER